MAALRPMTSKHCLVISLMATLFLFNDRHAIVLAFKMRKRLFRGLHIFHAAKHLSLILIIKPLSRKCSDQPPKTLVHTLRFQ